MILEVFRQYGEQACLQLDKRQMLLLLLSRVYFQARFIQGSVQQLISESIVAAPSMACGLWLPVSQIKASGSTGLTSLHPQQQQDCLKLPPHKTKVLNGKDNTFIAAKLLRSEYTSQEEAAPPKLRSPGGRPQHFHFLVRRFLLPGLVSQF